jgi:hypothetical protein
MARRRKWILAAAIVGGSAFAFVFVATDALVAGGESPPAALSRAAIPSDAFPAASARVLEAQGFDVASARKVARDTYLIERHGRHGEELCVASTHKGRSSGGCNPKSAFSSRQPLVWSLDEEGEPSAPSALWLSGAARPHIVTVRARFGSLVVSTPVTREGGFFIEATPQALAQGRPTVLEGLDVRGTVVATIPLPRD